MSDMGNFADLAQTKVGDVEKPKPLPEGRYTALFSGPMKQHKAKSGNLAMRFPFKLVAPGDEIDAEELASVGGIPDKEFSIDFWMSPDARWRFTEFGKAMGASDQLNLIELAEALATGGDPFSIQVKHEASQDGESVFMRFDNPQPVA